MKNIFKNKGFLSVEMIVAFSVISISVLAATTVAQKSIQISNETLHITQASFLLEEGAEIVHVARDNTDTNTEGGSWVNWSNALSWMEGSECPVYDSSGKWTWWSSVPSNGYGNCQFGIFTRTINFSDVYRDASSGNIVSSGGQLDYRTRMVTVTVTWPEGKTTLTKSLQFYINDISNT